MNAPARMKPLSVEDRESIRSVYIGPYMHGGCAALAIAISRRTGWLLAAIRDGRTGKMLHAGAETPDGRYVDVRGYLDEAEFTDPHHGRVSWIDEETLLAENPHIQERDIDKASGLLSLLFENLPGEDRKLTKLDSFAEELEDLSRKHGIWLRSDGPRGIIAYDAYGDESGYVFGLGLTGDARIERGPFEPEPTQRYGR